MNAPWKKKLCSGFLAAAMLLTVPVYGETALSCEEEALTDVSAYAETTASPEPGAENLESLSETAVDGAVKPFTIVEGTPGAVVGMEISGGSYYVLAVDNNRKVGEGLGAENLYVMRYGNDLEKASAVFSAVSESPELSSYTETSEDGEGGSVTHSYPFYLDTPSSVKTANDLRTDCERQRRKYLCGVSDGDGTSAGASEIYK